MYVKTKLIIACIALVALDAANQNPMLGQDITITIKKGEKADEKPEVAFEGKRPSVDVAILLDTSNSMDGLISQAKSQLWNIVQDFAAAKKSGQTPRLRVSVFEYGNTRLPASEGFIRQVVELTDDLDRVSEALFSLKTSGGDEYCGKVINESLKRLDWSTEDNAYKAIFIAGNEPFTQGSVDYKQACRKAIESGVIVNTVHCGNYQKGVDGKWKEGATMSEGEYMNIDQDKAIVRLKTPHDKIIIELNNDLNKTYLWYGSKQQQRSFATNQIVQDNNAWASGAFGGRGGAKVSGVYDNRARCVVDAWKAAGSSPEKQAEALRKISKDDLPEKLQKLSEKERLVYIENMNKKRIEIQKKIVAENTAREKYVAKMRKNAAEAGGDATLGDAVSKAVRLQLQKKGFNF